MTANNPVAENSNLQNETIKKIQSPKKSFYEFPLRKIFKIDEFAARENVLVNEVGFSERVQKLLARNNIKSLVELLNFSLEDISNMQGFGKNSIDNLTDTLKKFASSKKKKISSKVFQRAKDDLDKFLRDAALRHDPQIDLIIAAFENFSANVIINSQPQDTLSLKMQALPKRIKNKKVHLLLHMYDFKHPEIFSDLPEDLTLSALPKWLLTNSKTVDEDEMNNFFNELKLDLKDFAKKIALSPFKSKMRRDIELIRLRAQGVQLERIGRMLNLTRERVRQIELNYVNEFMKSRFELKKLFNFIYALNDGKTVLNLDDLKKFIDEDDAEIIWFVSNKMNLGTDVFNFDKSLQAFVFYEDVGFTEAELLEAFPEVVEEEIFNEKIEAFAQERNCPVDLLKNKLERFYECTGKIFHRIPLNLGFKFSYIVKECFPNGYKISNKNFFSRFMKYRQEIFGEDSPITERNLDATLARTCVLCDRGRYIHPDFVNVSPEVIQKIKDFIDASDRTAIFYKEIFESLKDVFADTQIDNAYFMQGVIKFYKLPYILRKDYLTKSDDMNMGKEFEMFVEERGEVTAQEIKTHFSFLRKNNIEFLLKRCVEVLRIGDGSFIHSSLLNLQEEDFEPIKEFLNQSCTKPTNIRALFGLFYKNFPDFMKRNRIRTHDKLFGVLQYMFRDKFNFSRPYISTEDIKAINARKILLKSLGDKTEIKIKDFISVSEDCGIGYLHKNYLLDCIFPDFIRVDEFSLMRPESVGVTEEVISTVSEKICEAVDKNNGWKLAKNFEDYSEFPQLEIAWNGFLLESVASMAGDFLYKLKLPMTYANFSLTIFLSEEFAEDDFDSFVKKILIAEHQKNPFRSEEDIFNWLNKQGLCNKKLPKFLTNFLADGKAFEFLK
ncbi:MAG: hypothetical protein IKZ53_05720 [Selenomonadaceae bacterium]|nr:hypothetical protein [Selenomonadaceae bacterium]